MSLDPFELIRKLSIDLQKRPDVVEAILDLLPIGIAIADNPLCSRTRMNRALARQVGGDESARASLRQPPLGQAPPKAFKDGRLMSLDDRPMYQAARRAAEVSGVVVDVVRTDGSHLTLIEYAAPLFDAKGSVSGAIGIFMDITERRRIEEEQRFLAHASALLSSSARLRNDASGACAPGGPDVWRLASGKLRIESMPVDLSGVILAAFDAMRPSVRARDLEVSLTTSWL